MRLSTGKTGPPFELAFLVSETEDGRWSGALLDAYYRDVRKIENVGWQVVEGLSPGDPKRFAHQGLRNLVRESSKLLRDAQHKALFRVINATGGFKAQISFAGLIGQTLGVPVVYQFETFPECIEMPPMPVDFDRETWLTHLDFFVRLSAGAVAGDELPLKELSLIIRDLLDSEEVDGVRLFALSPILELMHQGFLARPPRAMKEPPASEIPEKDRWQRAGEHHLPKGTESFARSLAERFRWIERIQDVELLNTARTHLLPGKDTVEVHDVCFSDGDLGVRLAVKTTAQNERHREFVRKSLAEFCTER